jgi:deoxyribodipyrimidine photo-lyase
MSVSPERIRSLNQRLVQQGAPAIVYWMQSSQRAIGNHALEYAVEQANLLGKPLVVYFGLTDRFPEANERHYAFMLEGLQEAQATLRERGIDLFIRKISPEQGVLELCPFAALVVVDRGYLRIERQWREFAASRAVCPVIQVETNVIVPVEKASPKEEYSAATLRTKISKLLADFAHPVEPVPYAGAGLSVSLPFQSFAIHDIQVALAQLDIDRGVGRVAKFHGGTSQANIHLENFIEHKLSHYVSAKSDPVENHTSDLSPYLHFGQISPLDIFLRVQPLGGEDVDSFLEELVVRRELSMNYVYYQPAYDSYAGLPQWARGTLEKHFADSRPYVYSLEQLEQSETHDPYWNAAQTEMVVTGKMHGYMRMYWGKKILEWSQTPQEAFHLALYLNNKYNLDGRDPNAFAGVAWCFGKHDRPWGERAIFGNVRYMNDKGLKRKFDMERYLDKIKKLM